MRLFRVMALLSSPLLEAAWHPPGGLDLYRPEPDNNRISPSKIALGRQLFRDRRLSRDGSLSCATCHDPALAFTDGRTLARGIGRAVGDRNTPTIINRAWGASFFFDGRVATLEKQVLQPILNSKELAATEESALALARSHYRSSFLRVFNAEPSMELIGRALASYVRTIVAGDSPFDRGTLDVSASRGLVLFRGKAGCSSCHNGPLFSDEEFHNTGVAWRNGAFQDEGRARVTGAPQDRGAFKTPTLRQIDRTAPYMRDGSLQTLSQVVDYYATGGRKNPGLDSRIHQLQLSDAEKRDLVAFLGSLTGRVQDGQ